jgi:predicted DNA-binding transcriptional regulator YafY
MYLLVDKKCIKASELAEHFEVSVRTIYRDVEMLSMAGIPIYTKKGKYGGIAILDNFILDKGIVSQDEQIQILSALQSIQEVEKDSVNEVINKLSSIFQIKNPNWISIDFSGWSNQNQELFQAVKFAIVKNQVLKFDYYNRNGEIITRKVEPMQLWFKGYTWYLKGYCQERQAMRIFKLSRMKRVKCLEEFFERKEFDKDNEEKFIIDTNSHEKVLSFSMKIDKCMAYRVYDSFEENEIKRNEEGDFIVSLSYPEDEWLYSMIMSFGRYAKIISPEALKIEIVNRFKEAYENYI